MSLDKSIDYELVIGTIDTLKHKTEYIRKKHELNAEKNHSHDHITPIFKLCDRYSLQ